MPGLAMDIFPTIIKPTKGFVWTFVSVASEAILPAVVGKKLVIVDWYFTPATDAVATVQFSDGDDVAIDQQPFRGDGKTMSLGGANYELPVGKGLKAQCSEIGSTLTVRYAER